MKVEDPILKLYIKNLPWQSRERIKPGCRGIQRYIAKENESASISPRRKITQALTALLEKAPDLQLEVDQYIIKFQPGRNVILRDVDEKKLHKLRGNEAISQLVGGREAAKKLGLLEEE